MVVFYTYSDHLGVINMSSNIECGLGVIASSLPSLHNLSSCCESSRNVRYTGEVSMGKDKHATSITTPRHNLDRPLSLVREDRIARIQCDLNCTDKYVC
jgi:hypothetical protein